MVIPEATANPMAKRAPPPGPAAINNGAIASTRDAVVIRMGRRKAEADNWDPSAAELGSRIQNCNNTQRQLQELQSHTRICELGAIGNHQVLEDDEP